ncbi:MAG: uroporphyrinogen-III synthase, partial [Eubacterium sp.]|nr:uroporphyrinogen-III synthase [Eubacterium sp.]
PNIVSRLMEYGKDPETMVGVLQEGTTARQKVAVGRLYEIVDIVKREGIKTPAITVVGDVVSLREVLDWYGKKPLFGQRVLVTGSRSMTEHLSPLLKEEGAEAISFSLIRTEKISGPELTGAIEEIGNYSWIVFTSVNGVEIFFDQIRNMRKDIRSFNHIHFAVIGEATQEALENHGIYADLVPTLFSSKDMAEAMIPHLTQEDNVLLLRAEEANRLLPDALEKAGIPHTCIALYHTVQDERKAEELNRLVKSCDYITFASSSAVRAFFDMVEDKDQVMGKYISIGPVTTKTAEGYGISVSRTAYEYTAKGIVDAVLLDVREK